MKFSSPRLRRGAVLIVTLLVAALIALVLGSYLNLSLSSARFASRTFYSNAAFNLVETGAEEAVWSFNHTGSGGTDGWSSWSHNTTDAWQKFDGFNFAANTSGSVKVYVENYAAIAGSFSPKVIALASVNPPTEAPVTQMLEVTLTRRSHFAGGLIAKDQLKFNGAKVAVDSWDSDPDNNPATAPVAYSATVRNDHGSVAGTYIVSSNQADILGYVTMGVLPPPPPDGPGLAGVVGNNGTIRGFATPPGISIDSSRVSTDFVFNFDPVAAPTGGTPLASIGSTLGTLGTTTSWQCNSLSLTGNQTLTILGQVTLVLTASSGADALTMTGNAKIIIPSSSSLTLYVEGNVRIVGNGGVANGNIQPATCQFWGTNASIAGQAIELTGNGSLVGIVYAPNAAVTLDGNSDMMGAVVANDITISGSASFHYDESLNRYGDASFGVVKWRELTTAAERQPYMSLMSGW